MNFHLSPQLKDNRILSGLEPNQIEEILPCIMGEVCNYKKHEQVLYKGKAASFPCVVLTGQLIICESGPDGNPRPLRAVDINGLVGEVDVFSTEGLCSHDVYAGEDSSVIFLSRDFFLAGCERACPVHRRIQANMLRILCDQARYLDKQVAYLTAADLKTKIAMYLCELYEATGSAVFTMPLNRDNLADFFAVARPSLSRELINLKSQGLIDFHRSKVTLLNVEELYRLSYKR